MEAIGKVAFLQFEGAGFHPSVLPRSIGIVEAPLHRRIAPAPPKFEDIDLSADRPRGVASAFVAACPQHPEGRPDSFALGELDSSCYFSVPPALLLRRVEAGGSVLVETMLIAQVVRSDNKAAVFQISIGWAVGVSLPLLIVPAGRNDLMTPVVGVEGLSLEFV